MEELNKSDKRTAYLKAWRERNPDYDRRRYLENREQFVDRSRAYNQKRTPEQRRKYRELNLDHMKEVNRSWREKNRERISTVAKKRMEVLKKEGVWENRNRDYQLKYRHRITLNRYQAMLSEQGGVCAICKEPPPKGKRLHVDHDHKTEVRRGLLCMQCNHALERLEKYPDWHEKALSYITGPR